jgi:hypothetical protein
MLVGLFFFIRASVKDRTEQVKLIAEQSEESFLRLVQDYFDQRSYRVVAVDSSRNLVTFQGFIQPSWFLAIFLSCLAAIGLVCLALILSFLEPFLGNWFFCVILFAPLTGFYYWQKAGRLENVMMQIETFPDSDDLNKRLVTITAHRDELRQIQESLPFTILE